MQICDCRILIIRRRRICLRHVFSKEKATAADAVPSYHYRNRSRLGGRYQSKGIRANRGPRCSRTSVLVADGLVREQLPPGRLYSMIGIVYLHRLDTSPRLSGPINRRIERERVSSSFRHVSTSERERGKSFRINYRLINGRDGTGLDGLTRNTDLLSHKFLWSLVPVFVECVLELKQFS